MRRRLHGDKGFMLDMEAAKGEMAALRGGDDMLSQDCEVETMALADMPCSCNFVRSIRCTRS